MSKQKSKAPAKLPPQLFNNHRQMALRNITVAVVSALFAGLTFNLLHNKQRKKKYRNFYNNYDADKSFMRMAEGGYLHSCPPCSLKEEENGEADKKKKK
ncbi:cytochrome c oxidase subunit 6C [Anastrepha ludens]|uniref:cytochrome c oxidase subunit 6C n=1 Tax=Anastrepha ludens TaxID=28586 RepID=UPI0023AFA8A1|nr:cytochrome c oxidase subunit 6C [Anastrepha ludens]XP_053947792.1 cytochrome c oxidase subunit 6C [Anastrepha ludens]